MKPYDLFLDLLANTDLYYAINRRQLAKEKVTDRSPTLISNLVKLFVTEPSSIDKDELIRDINIDLFHIEGVYIGKKRPDAKTLYTWIIFDSSPHYDAAHVDRLVYRWKTLCHNLVFRYYDAETVMNQVINIIHNVCQDIENLKFQDISNYLPGENQNV